MARYIDVDKVELKGLAVFDENLDVLVPLSVVRKALQMTPTADVVPNSEVAREIFEEIWEMFIPEKSATGCAYYFDMYELAELKKKYTGERT